MTSLVTVDLRDPELNAALALDVYRDPENTPQIPAGWKRYLDCPVQLQKDGYFGAAYIYINDIPHGYVYIIIAHRGTANTAGKIEDVEMFLHDTVPAQFKSAAIPFIDLVLEKAGREFPDESPNYSLINIGFTGHSLGATLAELCMAYYGSIDFTKFIDKYPNVFMLIDSCLAVTFESPGSVPLIDKLINEGLVNQKGKQWASETYTYNADVNAINTLYEHPADFVYSVAVGYDYLPQNNGKLPFLPNNQFYWFKKYTVADQHSMSKMYQAICSGAQKDDSLEWPVGAEAALESYLSDGNSNQESNFHSQYWDGYIELLWQQYPDTQKCYESFDDFHRDYIENFLGDSYRRNKTKRSDIVPAADDIKSLHIVLRLSAGNYQPTMFSTAPKIEQPRKAITEICSNQESNNAVSYRKKL